MPVVVIVVAVLLDVARATLLIVNVVGLVIAVIVEPVGMLALLPERTSPTYSPLVPEARVTVFVPAVVLADATVATLAPIEPKRTVAVALVGSVVKPAPLSVTVVPETLATVVLVVNTPPPAAAVARVTVMPG